MKSVNTWKFLKLQKPCRWPYRTQRFFWAKMSCRPWRLTHSLLATPSNPSRFSTNFGSETWGWLYLPIPPKGQLAYKLSALNPLTLCVRRLDQSIFRQRINKLLIGTLRSIHPGSGNILEQPRNLDRFLCSGSIY